MPGLSLSPRPPVDFSRALAGIRLEDAVIDAEQIITGLGTSRVRDLAATLAAVEAAAVASWCCDTAAQYARTRHQFGRAIGCFQAVKHLCAEMLCRAELASAVAWDAAIAVGAPDELPLAAAVAAAVAPDAALECAKDCIQILGGIGFTWEHDAHLYLRRAITCGSCWAVPRAAAPRAAALTGPAPAGTCMSSPPRAGGAATRRDPRAGRAYRGSRLAGSPRGGRLPNPDCRTALAPPLRPRADPARNC